MGNGLHFLYLEDNPVDVELIRDILEEQWFDCTIERVQTEADFCTAIERGGIDLILADYTLPTFDGISALDIARQHCPEISFIFVSGTMGEEVAIESLKRGATDYVLKNNLSRLVPSIDRSLKYSLELKQRQRVEYELSRKNIELEQFIYAVSHDLRSPLVTFKTFLGFLDQDISAADNENIDKDMKFIHSAANRMETLLNELLDISRIGRTILTCEEVPFRELAAEALDAVAGQISAGKVDVQVSEVDLVLCGDRRRLLQVWQNLLDNAVKYLGDQSMPCIEIGFEQQQGATVFFVCDNGIGIAPEYQEKVFGIFEQLDRKTGGVGMGLTMVRRIVELYGGHIRVESGGEGQGSCFRFTLPGAVKQG